MQKQNDIVTRIYSCGISTPEFALLEDAAKEVERLRDCCSRWKNVAELFNGAYTTDESGQFTIPNGSDLFRAVMAHERALRDE